MPTYKSIVARLIALTCLDKISKENATDLISTLMVTDTSRVVPAVELNSIARHIGYALLDVQYDALDGPQINPNHLGGSCWSEDRQKRSARPHVL